MLKEPEQNSNGIPFEVLQTFCPDEKTKNSLLRISTNTPHVREIEFDDLVRSIEHTAVGEISSQDVRKNLSTIYVDYLGKTFPGWRRFKEVLHHYPGITQDWQLFDPYNAIISHVKRPDTQGIIPKSEYKVALIFPRTFEERASILSQAGREYLGFEELYLALNDAGYPTQIFNAEQKGLDIQTIVDQTISSGTKVVGINLTAMTARDGLKVAKKIKDVNPSIKIFLGGHHISLAVQEEDIFSIKEFDPVDTVIVGKGDISLPLAIDAFRRNEPVEVIPDIVFRENPDRTNIIHAWRAIPLSKYPTIPHIQLEGIYDSTNQAEKRSARMSTSEGCIGNCSYCTSVSLYDRHYSPRSITQVVDEIEFLQRQFGINSIFFNDDIFIKPGKDGFQRANEFCDELERRNIHINFRPLVRPDSIPFTEEGDELFRRLKRNGMVMVYVGFESASTKMLDIFDKLVDVNNYKRFVDRAKREKVALQLGFIAWHPLMNINDANDNFRFLYETDELYNFSVMVQKLDVFPGTREKKRLTDEGLLFPGFNCLSDPQNYYFQDRNVGQLADSLNRIYRADERFERFDKAISRLHLTVIPELLHQAEILLQNKPSSILSDGIKLLQRVHGDVIHSINDLLYRYIQEHLGKYGTVTDLDETLKTNFDQLFPQLSFHLQTMHDAIDYLVNSSLRQEGKFEQMIDTLFPWNQFPNRIDRNIAVRDGGIFAVINTLSRSGLNFKVITDKISANAVIAEYPELEPLLNKYGVFDKENEKTEMENLVDSHYDCVVGIGGGNVLDLTKRTANRSDRAMILLPTILSTNTFSSPVIHPIVSKEESDYISSSRGRIPDFVLVDPIFLSKQDYELNRLGLGDIVAIYSAREDWKRAVESGQSRYNSVIDLEAQNILNELNQPTNLSTPQGITHFAHLLTSLSYCTVNEDVGSNSASGSEKIFSTAALQKYGDAVYHGDMMVLGTFIMAYLQGRDMRFITDTLRNIGFNFSLSQLSLDRKKLVEILMLAKQISLKKDRRTVIDDYQFNQSEAENIVDSLIAEGYLIE